MKTAKHFPYVRQWNDIDVAFSTGMEEIGLGQKPVKDALDAAAVIAQDALNK